MGRVEGQGRHQGIQNTPDLPTFLPALLDGRLSRFWNLLYLRLFSVLVTSPASLHHSQKVQTGLAPPCGSHSLPPVLVFLLKINSISFSPWLTLCESMSSSHTQQTLTQGPDTRVICPQALLLPVFQLGTLTKEEGKIIKSHSLSQSVDLGGTYRLSLNVGKKNIWSWPMCNFCLHSHGNSSLSLTLIFAQ